MSELRRSIWFWQRIVSPHMAGLASALARQDCDVVYVAEQSMSKERAQQGWSPPDLGLARLELAPTTAAVHALVKTAPHDAIHICQGIRANGLVGKAQKALASQGLQQWVVMETVANSGWRGFLKRLEYQRLFIQWRRRIEGVLAIGHLTSAWVIARGLPPVRAFPFAYFLPGVSQSPIQPAECDRPFRFAFVGRIIELKRLDLLISALAAMKRNDVELVVIGSGPLEDGLHAAADSALPDRIHWMGHLPMRKVPYVMTQADCLVLPSRYDGWGAVVSEALMAGTPAICSDACGSAGVVQASKVGGVFRSGDVASLAGELERVLQKGPLTTDKRVSLANWARCVGADSGAKYLLQILAHRSGAADRPSPPWMGNSI